LSIKGEPGPDGRSDQQRDDARGFTRTMTTAIALETSKGDLPLGLGLILLVLSVAVSTVAFLLVGRVGEK
jgi:tungstate transport system permease protein